MPVTCNFAFCSPAFPPAHVAAQMKVKTVYEHLQTQAKRWEEKERGLSFNIERTAFEKRALQVSLEAITFFNISWQ